MCCSFDTEQSKMSVQATCALTIHVWVASTAGCQPAHPFRVNMSCRSREVPRCSCCRLRRPAIQDVSSSGTLAWRDSSVTPAGWQQRRTLHKSARVGVGVGFVGGTVVHAWR